MRKKLTITIDEAVYEALHRQVGRRYISRFIEDVTRTRLLDSDLDAAYREMARDETGQAEALEWIEGVVGDLAEDRNGTDDRR